MAKAKHPTLGPIGPLLHQARARKVWKHLYSPQELWTQVLDPDVDALRRQTERLLGLRRSDSPDLPAYIEQHGQGSDGFACMQRHHDDAYAPAYAAAIQHAGTRWATAKLERKSRGLSVNAVFVVVSTRRKPTVLTAFRPHPPASGVIEDEAGIRAYANDYFDRACSMSNRAFLDTVVSRLPMVAADVPTNSHTLWRLAAAVGFARAAAADEQHPDLEKAERVLASVPAERVESLKSRLAFDFVQETIEAALMDEDIDEFERGFLDAEEILAVATALGGSAQVRPFVQALSEALAWVPSEWQSVRATVVSRMAERTPDGTSNELVRFWRVVDDAVLGAALRSEPGARLPVASSAAAVVQRVTRGDNVLSWLAAQCSAAANLVTEWLDGLFTESLQPQLGGGGKLAIVQITDLQVTHTRCFVVDDDTPDGYELEHDSGHGAHLWEVDAGERVTFIVFSAEEPIPGETLGAVRSAVELNDRIRVSYRMFNVPR